MKKLSLSVVFFIILILGISTSIASELKILTFNAWLLESPLVHYELAEDIDARLKIMPKYLANTKADIIVLQEVWKYRYRKSLTDEMSKKYKYKFLYHNPKRKAWRMGNGLLIFSKHPFCRVNKNNSKSNLLIFSNHTRLDELFVQKGAIHACIQHSKLGEIDLFTTHVGALSFDHESRQYNIKHFNKRNVQLNELISFINKKRNPKRLLIVAGDFNTHDHLINKSGKDFFNYNKLSKGYLLLTKKLEIIDTYRFFNIDSSEKSYNGLTFSPDNQYIKRGEWRGLSSAERVDYVFIDKRLSNFNIQIINSKIIFKDQPITDDEEKLPALSDHFGLLTTLKF